MKKLFIAILISGFFFIPNISYSKEIKIGGKGEIRTLWEEKEDKYYFQIYKLWFKVYGEIEEGIDYLFRIRTKKGEDVKLVEGHIAFSNILNLDEVILGQFKVPFGFFDTMILEYPKIKTEPFKVGDKKVKIRKRDIGVKIKKSFKDLDAEIVIINGDGRNVKIDSSKRKDFGGRFILKKEKINLGLNFYQGNVFNDDIKDYVKFYRYGVDLKVDFYPITLLGEYIKGKNGSDNIDGYYAQIGYSLNKRLKIIAHYGDYLKSKFTIVTSLKYKLGELTTLQAEYVMNNEREDTDNDLFVLQYKVVF